MAKFVAVKKYGRWQVVYLMAIGEGHPPEKLVEPIKKATQMPGNQQEALQLAEKLNAEFFPAYRVVPFIRYGEKTPGYLAAWVKRDKLGQVTGRRLCETIYESEEAAQSAFLLNSDWVVDCLANRLPVATVNGVRIHNCTKQSMKMLFWFRGLLPNGRLLDFDARKLAAVFEYKLERDDESIEQPREAIQWLWDSIRPSFDLAGWIEQNGSESYLNLGR